MCEVCNNRFPDCPACSPLDEQEEEIEVEEAFDPQPDSKNLNPITMKVRTVFFLILLALSLLGNIWALYIRGQKVTPEKPFIVVRVKINNDGMDNMYRYKLSDKNNNLFDYQEALMVGTPPKYMIGDTIK